MLFRKRSCVKVLDNACLCAILNYSSSFSLRGDTDIIGSVVSKYSVDFQSDLVSIKKGNVPEFAGLVIGLDPFVVPGSYLEY